MFNASDLLKPISDIQPCGEEISFSREIDVIIEARRSEDATLNQGEWVTEVKTASWPIVTENCVSLLRLKSKDLRFAVWLTEASVKTDHFAGLAEGCLLIAGLFNIYWDGFYPEQDESDGHEQRAGNLKWLLTRALTFIKEVPITEGRNTAFSTIDFEMARRQSTNTDAAQQSNGGEDRSLATLENSRRKSSKAFYQKLLADAQYAQSALISLEKAVDERLGVNGPSFSPVKETLDLVITNIARFAKDAGVKMAAQEESSVVSTQINGTNPMQQTKPAATQHNFNSQIQNRADALLQLRNVANFFRETEPHSPVAYLADKAADWGDMPLHAWLGTVIKDSGSLSHVKELLGIDMLKDGHEQSE